MNILVTGAAGFIGFHIAKLFLKKNYKVIGIDNVDDYYSVKIKYRRINQLKKFKKFKFFKLDLINFKKVEKNLKKQKIDQIYHFAAQAGVRYTISNPEKYVKNNIVVFYNLLELTKKFDIKKMFFASSSSVYGDQKKYPVNETFSLNEKNIYGFSKKINEKSAKVYSNYNDTKFIGLRFFTVFGEWGRPDMLIYKYMKAIFEKKIFKLNANGSHYRDFTYIKDVEKIIEKISKKRIKNKYQIFNICSNNPINVKHVVNSINNYIGKKNKVYKINPEILKRIEVNKTHGDNKKILKFINGLKFTKFDDALNSTIAWYIKNKFYKY